MLVPVFGDMAHAVNGTLADGSVRDILAVERNFAAAHLFQARQRGDKFRLAVAFNARQADDLTSVHLKGDVGNGIFLMRCLLYTSRCV